MANAWETFKSDLKANNAKFKDGQKANIQKAKARTAEINAEGKARREAIEKPSMKEVSGSRKLWALWFALLTAPLFLLGVFLLFVAGVIIWTMF